MLSVFVPDAVQTGRYDLRPDCYVRVTGHLGVPGITLARGLNDPRAGITLASYVANLAGHAHRSHRGAAR